MTVSGWCAAAASNQLQPLCDILEIVLCWVRWGGGLGERAGWPVPVVLILDRHKTERILNDITITQSV